MNAKEEQAWQRGRKSAFRSIVGEAAREMTGKGMKLAAAMMQLHDTREALRRVCEDHGDNDWSDDLHLADVIEKHLARHLDSKAGGGQ